jgi:exopolysaccharide biosynthesis protein
VTNGGPLLVQDGRAIDRTREEGFVEPLPGIEPRQPLPQYLINTVYLLGYRETGQPRTLAARTRTGRLLFVLVDGRRPDWSVGLSLQDATDLLLHFEAEAGINLDGGGSAAMWANGAVVNVVSGGGERAVSDVIVLIPEAPSVP